MTAIVAIENYPLEKEFTVSDKAVGVEGSSIYLKSGEKFTMKQLLYALLLQSANDAATAIAVILSGSVGAFAQRMNEKAMELGLSATHFTNPHGLDDEMHYTSASDLARLTVVALENPTFARIVSTLRYQVPVKDSDSARLFVNHNRLLKEYDGCIGVKTGYTKRTGRCLVSPAKRDGIILVAVTLNDPNDWRDHTMLLDYGFSCCQKVTLTPEGGIVATIPIVGSESKNLRCESREEVLLTLPQGSQPTVALELPQFAFAGIRKGKKMGRVVWYLEGKTIAEVPLYAAEDANAKAYPPTIWEKIGNFFVKIGDWIIKLFKN